MSAVGNPDIADDPAVEWVEAWVEDITPLMVWTTLIFILVCITLPLLFCAEQYCFNDWYKVSQSETEPDKKPGDDTPPPKEDTQVQIEPEPEPPPVEEEPPPPAQDVIIQTDPLPPKPKKKCRKKKKAGATVQTDPISGKPCRSGTSTMGTGRCRKKSTATVQTEASGRTCRTGKSSQTGTFRSGKCRKRNDAGTDTKSKREDDVDGIGTQTERRTKLCTCPCGGEESKAHLCTCNKVKMEGECQTEDDPCAAPGGCTCPCGGEEAKAHLCTCGKTPGSSSSPCSAPGGCTCPCGGDESKAHLCTCGPPPKAKAPCEGNEGYICSCGGEEGKAKLCTCSGSTGGQGQDVVGQAMPGGQNRGRNRQGQSLQQKGADGQVLIAEGIDLSRSSRGAFPENKINKYLQWDWDDPCACPENYVGKRLKGLSWTQVIDYAQADGGEWTKSKDSSQSQQQQNEEEDHDDDKSEQFSEPEVE